MEWVEIQATQAYFMILFFLSIELTTLAVISKSIMII